MKFQKGRSGNPGGRPRKNPEDYDLEAAARSKAADAFGTLVKIMGHGEIERNRMAAAIAILERGYGKAQQKIEQTAVTKPMEEMTDEELMEIIQRDCDTFRYRKSV